MSERGAGDPLQITARGPRAAAEAAAAAFDRDPLLEAATYSIIEEDEAEGRWRIDAYPTSDAEAAGLQQALARFPALEVGGECWPTQTAGHARRPSAGTGRPFFVYGRARPGEFPTETSTCARGRRGFGTVHPAHRRASCLAGCSARGWFDGCRRRFAGVLAIAGRSRQPRRLGTDTTGLGRSPTRAPR